MLREDQIKAAISEAMGIVVEGGEDMVSRSLYRQRDRAVENVLAILGKYEIVTEHEFTGDIAEIDICEDSSSAMPCKTLEFNPGDTVIILKRRGDKDG